MDDGIRRLRQAYLQLGSFQMLPFGFLQFEPLVRPVHTTRLEFVKVISGVAPFPVVRNEVPELIARHIIAKAAVLNAFLNAALDTVAVRVDTRDTARAPGRVVVALAAPVSTERGGGPFPGHRVIPPSGPLEWRGPAVWI